jgi:hypothetical protein
MNEAFLQNVALLAMVIKVVNNLNALHYIVS